MAPLIKELKTLQSLDVTVCITGQHRFMLDQMVDLFKLKIDYDLDVMEPSQGLHQLTSRLIIDVGKIIEREKPDLVLVHGDTTTAFCSAVSAFYHGVDVGHVEAGLRTGDITSPWPEEANRKWISSIAKLHFAPTENAKNNLLNENIPIEGIFLTGNTVVDALLETQLALKNDPHFKLSFRKAIREIKFDKDIILVSSHRRENLGSGLENICLAICELVDRYPEVQFIFTMHLNPKVRNIVVKLLRNVDNVTLTEPLSYAELVWLMSKCKLILTDSGGIQEEAPTFGVPVLVLRDKTERMEIVDAGCAKLIGVDCDNIIQNVVTLLTNPSVYNKMSQSNNPFGDGTASSKIREVLEIHYG